MKETIYYLSDLKWYSKITGDTYKSKTDVLRAHLNYIEKSKDFVFALSDKKHILKRSKLADKRVNSRIAVSFVLAIPNDLEGEQVRQFAEEVRGELADMNDMDREDIYIAFHDAIGISGKKNKHFHIVLPNVNRAGKSIRLGRDRSVAKELHKRIKGLIESRYTIRKDSDEDRLEHIGPALRYNKELRQAYLEYLQAKEEIKAIEKKKREAMISLEFAKQHINLVEFAVNKFGYRVDRRKSSKHYKTLKRDGDVIIVKRNSRNQHWIYFSAVNENDNGTIIDFIQNRTGDSLGAVRRFLQEYLKEKREGKIKEITDFELEVSSITEHQNAVLREYTRLRDLSRDNYLNKERGISIELSKYDIWEDDKGNVVFGLYGENGELIGLAKYNSNFKQITGQKGVWTSYTGNREDVKKIKQIVITESPIDALSYKELYNDDDKIFLIATMGQIGERTINIIKSYIRAVTKLADVENIVVALDNDEAGRRMSEKLQSELSREFDNVIQDIPLEKDWNAELKRGYYGPQI